MSNSANKVLLLASKELGVYCDKAGTFMRNAVENSISEMLDGGIDPKSEFGLSILRSVAIKGARESTLYVIEPIVAASFDYFNAVNGTNLASAFDSFMAMHEESVMPNAVAYIDKQIGKLSSGKLTLGQFVQRAYDCGSSQANRMHCNALDFALKKTGMFNKKARWARIPVGDTCDFCIMLASRGFVYRTAEAAGMHYHANCDCRVSNKVIGDYRPEKYYDQWRDSATEKILRDGYKGTSAAMLEAIEESYPKAYSQWMEYCAGQKRINEGAQRTHIFGTNEYLQALDVRDDPPSYFAINEDDVFRLVSGSVGYGYPDVDADTGEWNGFYYFTAKKAIGVVEPGGSFTRTFRVNCKSENFIHAYPSHDRRLEPDEG